MILYTGESEAIGISPTPIDFIEEQELSCNSRKPQSTLVACG